MIESAAVIGFMMLFLLASIDMSIFFFRYSTLQQAGQSAMSAINLGTRYCVPSSPKCDADQKMNRNRSAEYIFWKHSKQAGDSYGVSSAKFDPDGDFSEIRICDLTIDSACTNTSNPGIAGSFIRLEADFTGEIMGIPISAPIIIEGRNEPF